MAKGSNRNKLQSGPYPLVTFFVCALLYCGWLLFGGCVLTQLEKDTNMAGGIFCSFSVLTTTGWGDHDTDEDRTLLFMIGFLVIGTPLEWMFVNLAVEGFDRICDDIMRQFGHDGYSGSSLWSVASLLAIYMAVGAYVLMVLSGEQSWTYRESFFYGAYCMLTIGYTQAHPPMNWSLAFFMLYELIGTVLIVDVLQRVYLVLCDIIYTVTDEEENSGKEKKKKKKK